MPKALQIGNDGALMQSRDGLFAAAGLQVRNLAGLAETLRRLPSAVWDVAILCHTLSEADRLAAMAALRRHNPRAPVLLVARRCYTCPRESGGFDAVLSATPTKMIPALRALLQRCSERSTDAADRASAAD